MKKQYIKDIIKSEIIDDIFLISNLEEKVDKNNKQYTNIELKDKTGILKSVVWSDKLEFCKDCSVGDIVKVKGEVGEYNKVLQVKVSSMQKEENYDLNDFVKTTKDGGDNIMQKIEEYIDRISNEQLKVFLSEQFANDEFRAKLIKHPASKINHHDYKGGLVEHILEMLSISDSFLQNYENLNKDIVYAGIILHDIGKLVELSDDNLSVSYTVKGKLLGHIYLGASWFEKTIPEDFSEDLRLKILHIILSHHGKLEFGSPVRPMTLEAIAVSCIDELSAKLNGANKFYNESTSDSLFTQKIFMLDNVELYTG